MTRSPRSTVVPHLTYSPFTFPYDLSVRQSLPIPLAVDIYLLRLHHFETISTHSILIKLLKQRSAVQIGFVDPGQIAVLFPPHQILFMYPTITSLTSRSNIQNLLHFVFFSIQFDLSTILRQERFIKIDAISILNHRSTIRPIWEFHHSFEFGEVHDRKQSVWRSFKL